MKHIQLMVAVLSLMLLCHCGGSDSSDASTNESSPVAVLSAKAFFPSEMTGVDPSTVHVSMQLLEDTASSDNKSTLHPVTVAVQGNAVADKWEWTVGNVPNGSYTVQLTYLVSEIPVATAHVASTLNKGTAEFEITAASFSEVGGGDLDGDGLSNLAEIIRGTDPAKVDTDGDGVNDASDTFPLDAKESKDSDVDGIGDNHDNCPQVVNATQTDTDQDAIGDLCDLVNNNTLDTDGDGVIDKLDAFPNDPSETADSDGDAVGDNKDNCPDVANSDQSNTDQVLKKAGVLVTGSQQIKEDGFGDACDDDPDGDGRNVVYVDATSGSDAAIGYFKSPVKTLTQGMLLANARKASVWVATGDYNVAQVTWLKGAQLYGGYASTFDSATRNYAANSPTATRLLAPGKATVLLLQNLATDTRFDGFHIIADAVTSATSAAVVIDNSVVTLANSIVTGNSASSDDAAVRIQNNGFATLSENTLTAGGKALGIDSTAVWVQGSTIDMDHTTISAGAAPHATGMYLDSTTAVINHSTILSQTDVKTQQRATGVWLVATAPQITESTITVSGSQVEGIYFEKDVAPPSGTVIKTTTFSVGGAPNPLLRDWNGVPYTTMSNGDLQANFGGGITQLFSSLIGAANTGGNVMVSP
ncbi:MAG: hypothetical protein COV45_06245 [Deltaproteobacteria bacterium CG11_big_fil_rev_8_21_14_0_20_47_16]|nr:MAG: hypothetical protein COV45_06245 [Deltaproteobacteria bacterium CG11_big_fil_rev_8_21_14_0_20_47_16]